MPCNDETIPTLDPQTIAKICEAGAEAEDVLAKMKAAEAANEDAYRAGLAATDPNSIIGQVIRAFPPMNIDQLLERTANAKMDSQMVHPRPRTTSVLGPFDNLDDQAAAEKAVLAKLDNERQDYKLNRANDPAPMPMLGPSRSAMNEPMLQFFAYKHLPPDLRPISFEFWQLAQWLAQNLPCNPERTTALRKLLEAKDCAVRAKLYKETG